MALVAVGTAAAAVAELSDNRLTQGFLSFWVVLVVNEATLPMTDSVPDATGDAVADVAEAVGSAGASVLDASDEEAPMTTGAAPSVDDELGAATVLLAAVGSGTVELATVPTLEVDEVETVAVDELGIKPPAGWERRGNRQRRDTDDRCLRGAHLPSCERMPP